MITALAWEVPMLGVYLYPDTLTYFLVKLLVLALVVGLWLMVNTAPVA